MIMTIKVYYSVICHMQYQCTYLIKIYSTMLLWDQSLQYLKWLLLSHDTVDSPAP